MKRYIRKKTVLPWGLALVILLALPACGQNTPPSAAEPTAVETAGKPAQTPAESTDTPAAEHMMSDIILLGGVETEAFLDVSDREITVWDQASDGKLLAEAKYPEEMPGASKALDHCDFTDLDRDGNSDMTALFQFEDGTSASLLWFFVDGGFVYNEEFSRLPGDAAGGE